MGQVESDRTTPRCLTRAPRRRRPAWQASAAPLALRGRPGRTALRRRHPTHRGAATSAATTPAAWTRAAGWRGEFVDVGRRTSGPARAPPRPRRGVPRANSRKKRRRNRLPADRGELRLQIRFPRFTRVVLDHPADRFRFETNPARARCRLPRLDGVVRRRRCRQCRQLLYRRDLTVQQHGGLADRGGPRRNRGTRATPRETTAAVRAPGQDGDVGGLSLTSV